MKPSISIRDIAREAGVSHTTVSRALRDSSLVRAEVREYIQRLANDMGYTPNAVAQSLKTQKTNTVGLVVTTIADPFVGRVVRGIEEVAQSANFSVFLADSYNDPSKEMAIVETFYRRRVDGIIIAASRISEQYTDQLARFNRPTVIINQQEEIEFSRLHSLSIDDYKGGQLATEHLIDLGHLSIAYLGVGNRPRSNRLRMEGYRDALQSAGIHFQAEWVKIASPEFRYHSDDVAGGRMLLPALLKSGVSAVFCYNDMTAVGAMLACRDLGVSVPEDLSIIGFDDIEIAQYVTPPLTTIHQPKLRLGQMAMQMLLDLLADRPVLDQVLPLDLFQRETTSIPNSVPVK